MSEIAGTVNHLVAANRILANEGVIDAYGHVSVRHPERPDRFLLSRSRSPQFVTVDDVLEFELDGTPVDPNGPAPYLERFIHGALYEARPEFNAVVHAHTESVLPFSITGVPLRAVVHDASDIGETVPVWEIRDQFGDETNLLVTDISMGRDLAATLGQNRVALMRGHGFAAGGASLPMTIRMVIYMARNAHVQTVAMSMGTPIPLSSGEMRARRESKGLQPDSPAIQRSWEYFAERAGCADLIAS